MKKAFLHWSAIPMIILAVILSQAVPKPTSIILSFVIGLAWGAWRAKETHDA